MEVLSGNTEAGSGNCQILLLNFSTEIPIVVLRAKEICPTLKHSRKWGVGGDSTSANINVNLFFKIPIDID
jgi:hypothetical protein